MSFFYTLFDKLRLSSRLAMIALLCSTNGAWAYSRLILTLSDEQKVPVAEAIVMLQPAPGIALAPRLAARELNIKQIDREFVPRVSVVALGSRATFPNDDAVKHNVFSFSKAKSFDIPIYTGASPTITFDRPGVVTLGCNIHDWMVGHIFVADTPIAELTKADGVVNIADLPAGSYTVRVWHPLLKAGELIQTITLNEPTQRAEITLSLNPPRTRYKPPLNLKRYD